MYHSIVRRTVRATFAEISAGNWQHMVAGLADPFQYTFHGEHALGGVRTRRSSVEAWWERVTGMLPGVQFDVLEVLVKGWPWRTRVAARVRVQGELPDGSAYENTMFQFLSIRWGRVTEIESMEDLQRLERALRVSAEAGYLEADAPPIDDRATKVANRA